MRSRWTILAVLFLARASMAFQFQAVAALSPFVMDSFGVGIAEVGLLIGLYLSPGIAMALPGGAIGRRFGDARAVAAGMVLMVGGGLVMALSPTWEAQLAGRLVAGAGGVLLNVLMTKMVTDWFAGREIATAMGIFVNSWPVGIAAALLVLPPLATGAGLDPAMLLVAGLAAAGLVLLLAGYRPPAAATPTASSAPATSALRGAALTGTLLAGSAWGLYNAALGMVFGFGPAMLVERGWSAADASGATSVTLWLVAVSVPLGGVLADRLGRRDGVLLAGLALFAAALAWAARADDVVLAFAVVGLVGGLSAGPIVSLPSEVLGPAQRAFGMGLFFTLFYLAIVTAPMAAGLMAEAAGSSSVAFDLGVWMLLACGIAHGLFRLTASRARGALP